MANVKFSDLSELTATAADDLFMITDDSETVIEKSKKVKQSTLRTDFVTRGDILRSRFTYKDSNEIYVGAGHYDVSGKIAAWVSQLTSELSGASASTWYYLYLDYSAITSLTVITTTELIWSATSPTFSNTKRGWYNGNDRCIFAVLTNSAGSIREFFHCGEYVCFADRINTWSYSVLNAAWTDWDLGLPNFSIMANITFDPFPTGSYQEFYWRTNGQLGTSGHVIAISGDNHASSGDHIVLTDTSGKIEIKAQTSARYVTGWTNGFYLPTGI